MTALPNNYNCYLFPDGGLYHIETSTLICFANQWTCFYVTGTSVMTELTIFTNVEQGLKCAYALFNTRFCGNETFTETFIDD